jgi:hypothetical protein
MRANDRRPVAELIALLAPAIGEEKAREAVTGAIETLGLIGGEVNREQALVVLDRIAASPGLLGISARFAKTKVHLRW